MTYTFACPTPCNRVIRISASDADDAVRKIIDAGAMSCRNSKRHDPCKSTRFAMPPLPDKQLNEVVRLIMQTEDFPETESRH